MMEELVMTARRAAGERVDKVDEALVVSSVERFVRWRLGKGFEAAVPLGASPGLTP